MALGVHQILKNPNASAYFVQRSYGNYLIYPDALTDFDSDFLKSKGGVYRQFIQKSSMISLAQVQLFKTFGASCVVANTEELKLLSNMKIEAFGVDFVDPMLKFGGADWGGTLITLKQKDEKVVFLGPGYYYQSNGQVKFEDLDCSEEVFDFLDRAGASWVFFSEHDESCNYVHL